MLKQRLDLAFFCAIEHRRTHIDSASERGSHGLEFFVAHLANGVSELRVLEQSFQLATNRFGARVLLEQVGDLLAQGVARPSQMGFENLADVHSAGYAEGIENDLNRRS